MFRISNRILMTSFDFEALLVNEKREEEVDKCFDKHIFLHTCFLTRHTNRMNLCKSSYLYVTKVNIMSTLFNITKKPMNVGKKL